MDIQSSSFPEDEVSMPGSRSPEANALSFIVKIWVEQLADEGGNTVWRGSITLVGSGERHYFKRLEEITEQIGSYLMVLGL